MFIKTKLGQISVQTLGNKNNPAIIFLHGIFMDHTLWQYQLNALQNDCFVITIDMPGHGQSQVPSVKFSLNDCALMLNQVLMELGLVKIHAVRHSWGGMTIIRAFKLQPELFGKINLFNTPIAVSDFGTKLGFWLQKQLSIFPYFYGSQAAKALYSKEFLVENTDLKTEMSKRLESQGSDSIKKSIDAVILKADSGYPFVQNLFDSKIPCLETVGETDYVRTQYKSEYPIELVKGGHIGPHEAPEETLNLILKMHIMD
jgi:pimeloyl-ACP methyl ester carboxylesterase